MCMYLHGYGLSSNTCVNIVKWKVSTTIMQKETGFELLTRAIVELVRQIT